MSKRKILTLLAVCLLALLCLTALSGCDLFASKYEISWAVEFDKEPSTNAKITVEGYNELPKQIPVGEEITVTIEGTNGYKVHRVKVNNRKIQPNESGNYVFTVSANTEVEITLRERVESVKMPDITFYAGETIDRKTIEAEIVYATGRTEKTNKYSIVYQSDAADAFTLGDTYYSVKLSADRENLYRIDMKQPVCYKGVIDPFGGVISESYVNALKTNTEIENVTVEDDGSISFTFTKPLTTDITLPTVDQLTKGEGDDFVFQNWSCSIPSGTDKSVTATAIYKAMLVNFTGVKLEMREVDGFEIPYLVLSGEFRAANNAYIYLCETNKKIEFSGTVVGGENTKRGDSFELLFDMRNTNDKDFFGAWLDVKVKAEIDGHIETQDINVTEYGEDFVDLASYVIYDEYRYKFRTYENLLKVETNDCFFYIMSGSLNENGEVILTISGNVGPKYAGNFAKLDIEYDASTNQFVETQYCEIDENGNYSVSMNLFSIPIEHNAYIHFWVIDNKEDQNILFVGEENNLQNQWCDNTNLNSNYNNVGLITGGGIRCANADATQTYYIGKGKWGGVVIYGRDDTKFSWSTNSAEIYIEEGRVKIAVIGSYTGLKAVMETELATWGYDLMENPNAASNGASWDGGWTSHTPPYVVTISDEGTFKFIFDVTDIEWFNTHSKACYTFHLGKAGTGADNNANPDLKLTSDLGNSSVEYNGKTYTLVSVRGSDSGAEFWGCLGLIIE